MATKRIAVIATIYRYLSHAQHFADRFFVGYPYGGKWNRPDCQLVSIYVDQKPEGDQSEDRAREFGGKVYPTIAEALRCGGDELACDAVLIIGEHGEYPDNEKGQKLYPRYEFFKECVEVFEADGRTVPVYNDKHLSYSFDKAKEMVDDGHRLGFPILAGSSLPVTYRLPDVELPLGSKIEEALMVGCGGSDPMDYHALEAMQCMIERRAGGETGEYYKKMLTEVREGLANAATEIPALAGKELEIAGFIWFQGWNDMFDQEALADYEANLVHLIKDVRAEFKQPRLPVIIGELGNGGPQAGANMLAIRAAQKAAAERKELRGNVKFVPTTAFARPKEQSPNVGHGHHWFGNAESYFLIGDALGKAMVDLRR